jgi:hypothetical protein
MYFDTSLKPSRRDCSGISVRPLSRRLETFFSPPRIFTTPTSFLHVPPSSCFIRYNKPLCIIQVTHSVSQRISKSFCNVSRNQPPSRSVSNPHTVGLVLVPPLPCLEYYTSLPIMTPLTTRNRTTDRHF